MNLYKKKIYLVNFRTTPYHIFQNDQYSTKSRKYFSHRIKFYRRELQTCSVGSIQNKQLDFSTQVWIDDDLHTLCRLIESI